VVIALMMGAIGRVRRIGEQERERKRRGGDGHPRAFSLRRAAGLKIFIQRTLSRLCLESGIASVR